MGLIDLLHYYEFPDFARWEARCSEYTETMSFIGTKILLENGYDGVTFWDYHPADSQRDAQALIVFNTDKSVSNWTQIR